MTFKELFERAKAIDLEDTICVSVSAWRHAYEADKPEEGLTCSIWSGIRRTHYEGTTPEIALANYIAGAGDRPAVVDAELVDGLGEI
jgi:hypothetical protein